MKVFFRILFISSLILVSAIFRSCEEADISQPIVRIISPAKGSSYVDDEEIPIVWEVEDNSEIKEVELFIDGNMIESFSSDKTTYLWNARQSPGVHNVFVFVRDVHGNVGESSINKFYTGTEADAEIIAPANNSRIKTGSAVQFIIAEYSEEEIQEVKLFIENVEVGSDDSFPFMITWNPKEPSPGFYNVFATVTTANKITSYTGDIEIELTEEGCVIPDLVSVPSGSFNMGSSLGSTSEQPEHPVTLTGDYFISKYEVSNEQFCEMLNYAYQEGLLTIQKYTGVTSKIEVLNRYGDQQMLYMIDEYSRIKYNAGFYIEKDGTDPVNFVTWYGAAFYCNALNRLEGLDPLYDQDTWSCDVYGKVGYRLPTEAEWEYAARYNDGRIYPWGNFTPEADERYCNCAGASYYLMLQSVTSHWTGKSQLGIYNMAGNVSEWVNDEWESYSQSYIKDPTGPVIPKGFAVIRGGNFANSISACRSTRRYANPKKLDDYGIGFRIAKTYHPKK